MRGGREGRAWRETEGEWQVLAAGCSAAARVAMVAVPVTISTVRKRKGLAFPVPRTILLASLIEGAPNCAALMGFHPATLRTRLFFLHSPFFLSLSLSNIQVLGTGESFGWSSEFSFPWREMTRTELAVELNQSGQ